MSLADTASTMPKPRLPVLATATESYRFVWNNRSLLALPLLLLFIVDLSSGFYSGRISARGQKASAIMLVPDMVVLIGALLFSMFVAVAIHRIIVLGEDRNGTRFWRRSRTLGSYFWTGTGMGFLGTILSLLFAYFFTKFAEAQGWWQPPQVAGSHRQLFPAEAVWAGAVLSLFIFVRFLLALPAAAVGKQGEDAIGSFEATRGNWFRLTAAAILAGLPSIALTAISDVLARDEVNEAMRTGTSAAYYYAPAYIVLSSAVSAVEVAILSAMLSISYRALVGERMAKPQPSG
jgi:hypothetical protein